MPISPKFEQMPKPNNKFLRLLADLVLPSDPADAAGDLVGPMMAAERVGGKVAKGLVGEAAENFKRWFGDSKVVDEAGDPLRVFHGTDAVIDAFDPKMRGTATNAESGRQGFWFTDRPDVASNYADYAAYDAKLRKAIEKADEYEKKGMWDKYDEAVVEYEKLDSQLNNAPNGQNVIPANLSLKNPATMDAGGEYFTTLSDDINALIKSAKQSGKDGVIIKNLDDAPGLSNAVADHYLAFEPTQIKSATGNRGTYDPNDPSIMKSLLPYLMYGLKPNENE